MKKKKKKKAKTKLWEKIFVTSSIIIIFIIIGIYTKRAIYYYKQTNYISEDANLLDIITNQMNVVYTGDGLYKDEETNSFYFYGKNTNNYLSYNGLLWRIISADSTGIKIITNESLTTLIWGIDQTYNNSIIYKWLNDDVFINTISSDIPIGNWCNSSIVLNDYHCENKTIAKVGLITTSEYLKAGGIDSYLNNNTYFWTLNTSEEQKAYYIHNEGGINNEVSSGNNYYSYGVRPVINLSANISYSKGEGTKDNPYIISHNTEVEIGSHSVGDYVKYQGYTWKIMNINNEYTKLILDGYILDENDTPLKLTYNKVKTYLNDTFIKDFNQDNLVKIEFPITEYNITNSYSYLTKKDTISSYVSIPIVGDIFTTDYEGNWLNTYANTKQKLIYTTSANQSLYADLENSENYIRPVIAIKNDLIIASGEGTKDNPFALGDE